VIGQAGTVTAGYLSISATTASALIRVVQAVLVPITAVPRGDAWTHFARELEGIARAIHLVTPVHTLQIPVAQVQMREAHRGPV